jgi:hypothetical protein
VDATRTKAIRCLGPMPGIILPNRKAWQENLFFFISNQP